MNFRTLSVLFFALVLLCRTASADSTNVEPAAKPEVEIQAWLSTHGGKDWSVHILPTGFAYFRFHSGHPFGTLSGEFFLDSDSLLPLLEEARLHQFDGLPRKIRPALLPLHAPSYTIEIRVDAIRRRVELYDPMSVTPSAERDRFSAIWDAVWKQFPLKPPGVPVYRPVEAR